MVSARVRYAALVVIALGISGCSSSPPPNLLPNLTVQAAAPGGGQGLVLQTGQWVSLQVTTPGFTNRFLRHSGGLARIDVVNGSSSAVDKQDATFRIVAGLDGTPCYSFESRNFPGEYLRHSAYRLHKDRFENSDLFGRDATFCAQTGLAGRGGVSFVSRNFPEHYIRHINGEVYVARNGGANWWDNPSSFNEDSSWNLAGPLGNTIGCNAVAWTRGVNYSLGTVVLFAPNNQYYKLVNVGTNGSDGTDPTISTWYWQPTACDSGNPPPSPPVPLPSGGFVVSEAQYNSMFPNRVAYYSYAGLIAATAAYPTFATTGSDVTRKQEAAAFLANISHESGGGQSVRELNQANWNSYCSSGNCGGKQYYGRGPTQLSWDYNYKAAGDALSIDLLNNPDLVATDSAVSWKTALWY